MNNVAISIKCNRDITFYQNSFSLSDQSLVALVHLLDINNEKEDSNSFIFTKSVQTLDNNIAKSIGWSRFCGHELRSMGININDWFLELYNEVE